MKEIGILFKGEMVRAIQRQIGYKTQTRRIMRVQPPAGTVSVERWHHPDPRDHFWAYDGKQLLDFSLPCPYGAIGDRLYVRETWQHSNWPHGPYEDGCHVFFRADYLDDPHGPDGEKSPEGRYRWWNSPLHLPKKASRIWLENRGVTVERLQDITEADCYAEGVEVMDRHPHTGRPGRWYRIAHCVASDPGEAYAEYIDHINGIGTFESNPWVWVIEFKPIRLGMSKE